MQQEISIGQGSDSYGFARHSRECTNLDVVEGYNQKVNHQACVAARTDCFRNLTITNHYILQNQ
jgi:hypothetical protein